MIRQTADRIRMQLEHMLQRGTPMKACFSQLEKRAKRIEELVVIEVMRESYFEMLATRKSSAKKAS